MTTVEIAQRTSQSPVERSKSANVSAAPVKPIIKTGWAAALSKNLPQKPTPALETKAQPQRIKEPLPESPKDPPREAKDEPPREQSPLKKSKKKPSYQSVNGFNFIELKQFYQKDFKKYLDAENATVIRDKGSGNGWISNSKAKGGKNVRISKEKRETIDLLSQIQ